MREYLDDAIAHRDDGYGRAQAHVRRELPKRFYKEATVKPMENGFAVALDGRVPKTPGGKQVIVPSENIAAAMAAEWAAQEQFIDPRTMVLTRLINSAVEAGTETMPALREEIVKYIANDLLLYRADTPQSLIERQEQHWDAALIKLARQFGVSFQPTIGIVHQPQPPATLARLGKVIEDDNLFTLTAMNAIMSITGSGLLALALRHHLLDADAVWAAAHVDEDHNIAMWGELEEIAQRRAQRRRDFDSAVTLLRLLEA